MILYPDTFNDHFEPEVARGGGRGAARRPGSAVAIPDRVLCCGRPLYDYGFLPLARRLLAENLDALRHEVRRGTLIVGLEPSCIATFRDELRSLFPGDPDAERLARSFRTLAELLEEGAPDWQPPQLARQAVAHGHCHHKAIMKMGADQKVWRRLGLDVELLDSGCCGLAGSFGFEADHYDLSIACGERVLLPAVRAAAPTTLVLADGFILQDADRAEHGAAGAAPRAGRADGPARGERRTARCAARARLRRRGGAYAARASGGEWIVVVVGRQAPRSDGGSRRRCGRREAPRPPPRRAAGDARPASVRRASMQTKILEEGPARTWALVFETGDQFHDELDRFVAREGIEAARFAAIGAFQRVTLGFYDLDRQEYRPIPIDEQVEVTNLLGNVSLAPDGSRKVHAHVVVAASDGVARGGHLLAATVRPTLELFLTESLQGVEGRPFLQRRQDEATGLALLAPAAERARVKGAGQDRGETGGS